jgi:hypothetical protein
MIFTENIAIHCQFETERGPESVGAQQDFLFSCMELTSLIPRNPSRPSRTSEAGFILRDDKVSE